MTKIYFTLIVFLFSFQDHSSCKKFETTFIYTGTIREISLPSSLEYQKAIQSCSCKTKIEIGNTEMLVKKNKSDTLEIWLPLSFHIKGFNFLNSRDSIAELLIRGYNIKTDKNEYFFATDIFKK